jgi:hypothetical protein
MPVKPLRPDLEKYLLQRSIILLVLFLGIIILLLSVTSAVKQFAPLDFNYSIGGLRDQITIFFTFNKTAKTQLFLTLFDQRLQRGLAASTAAEVFSLALKARGYLRRAVELQELSREELIEKADYYNLFLNQFQEKFGQNRPFESLRIKDPLAF